MLRVRCRLMTARLVRDRLDSAAQRSRERLAIVGRATQSLRNNVGTGEAVGLAVQAVRECLGPAIASVRYVAADQTTHEAVPASPGNATHALEVRSNDALLGTIEIDAAEPLEAEALETAQIIADQLGAALHAATLVDELHAALATAQLVHRTSQRMSTAMSIQDVVAAYLEQVAAGGRYTCSIALDDASDEHPREAFSILGRWIPDQGMQLDQPEPLPYLQEGLQELLRAGETWTVAHVATDARVSASFRERQLQLSRPAVVVMPLVVQDRTIGFVSLGAPETTHWRPADLRPYQVTAALLAAAIDSRRQLQRIHQQGQELAVVEERRRLARELHDSVTQSLVTQGMLAQAIPELWRLDRDEATRSLRQVYELTRSALAEMRDLLVELRPSGTGEQDVVALLRRRAADFERRTGLVPDFEAPSVLVLPEHVAHTLARTAQEALANVAQHAHARRVAITVTDGAVVSLIVEDDGRGFTEDRVRDGAQGLISMQERAASIGANLNLQARPGQGTRVVLDVPREKG